MPIDFYFDPVCPWCWITSRWLDEVSSARDLEVTWRSFSLLLKNDTRPDDRRYRGHRYGLEALRVIEAVRDRHGDGLVGDLYAELGRRYHHERQRPLDLPASLAAVGLDSGLAASAEEDMWDQVIEDSMKQGLAVAGEAVGVPLIVFEGDRGFFGPIVSPVPTGDAALELFDHVAALATMDGFWELKRSRDGARPVLPES